MKQEKLQKLLHSAELWAIQLHDGQQYNGVDYVTGHVQPVVDTVKYITQDSHLTRTEMTLVQVVAWLHDTVEDTQCTIEDIRKQFGRQVAESVLALTKIEGESYDSAIARACRYELSSWVKKADNLVNLRESLRSGQARRIKKYLGSLQQLTEV
jgi:(p)ppGpp synthase/HD superfamily hydrolase